MMNVLKVCVLYDFSILCGKDVNLNTRNNENYKR